MEFLTNIVEYINKNLIDDHFGKIGTNTKKWELCSSYIVKTNPKPFLVILDTETTGFPVRKNFKVPLRKCP